MVSLKSFSGDKVEWNEALLQFPEYTMYQSYEWGEHKSNLGWKVLLPLALANLMVTALLVALNIF